MQSDEEIVLNRHLSMTPVSIQLELTAACNLMCKFCHNTQESIACDNYEEIIDRLHDENVNPTFGFFS